MPLPLKNRAKPATGNNTKLSFRAVSMFIIYNRKTKRVYQEQYDSVMHTLEVIPVSKRTVLLTAEGMHSVLVLDLTKIQKSFQIVPYFELFNCKYLIDLRCLDCGEEAAEWITKYVHLRIFLFHEIHSSV